MATIVITGEREDIVAGLRELLHEAGLFAERLPNKPEGPTELPTQRAKQVLIEKGYQCTSDPGFRSVLKMFEIEGRKRGRDKWYRVADLAKIPSK